VLVSRTPTVQANYATYEILRSDPAPDVTNSQLQPHEQARWGVTQWLISAVLLKVTGKPAQRLQYGYDAQPDQLPDLLENLTGFTPAPISVGTSSPYALYPHGGNWQVQTTCEAMN